MKIRLFEEMSKNHTNNSRGANIHTPQAPP
jgi:hypothetical protein